MTDILSKLDISAIPEYTGKYLNQTVITSEIADWCATFHAGNVQSQLAWLFAGLFIPMLIAIILMEWDNWPVFGKIEIEEKTRITIARYLVWFTVLALCGYFIYFIWFDPFALMSNST